MTAPAFPARLAQQVEQPHCRRTVAGSTPAAGTISGGAANPPEPVEPGRLPSDAPGATIRITVLHLGGREICAEDARDMGLTAGAIVGPREWAVLLGHSGKVWGRVG